MFVRRRGSTSRTGHLRRGPDERERTLSCARTAPSPVTSSGSGTSSTPTDIVLGRLAVQTANLLRGKHKPTFAPHMDMGDFVIVVNAEKVALSGDKKTTKLAYRHSGYPGGLTATPDRRAAREGRPQGRREGRLGHAPQEQAGSADHQEAQGLRRPGRTRTRPSRPSPSRSPRSPSSRRPERAEEHSDFPDFEDQSTEVEETFTADERASPTAPRARRPPTPPRVPRPSPPPRPPAAARRPSPASGSSPAPASGPSTAARSTPTSPTSCTSRSSTSRSLPASSRAAST